LTGTILAASGIVGIGIGTGFAAMADTKTMRDPDSSAPGYRQDAPRYEN
jgi:hypothetical protein